MSDEVCMKVSRAALANMTCRFGCESPVIGIFHAPKGCACWPDQVQALCAQHASKMESSGPVTCILDFTEFEEIGDPTANLIASGPEAMNVLSDLTAESISDRLANFDDWGDRIRKPT